MKLNQKISTIILIFFLPLLVVSGEYELVDSIVAVVNDKVITEYEIKVKEKMLYQFLKSKGLTGDELEKKFNEQKKNLLEGLIEEKLLLSKAEELELDVENDLELYIENIKKENNLKTDEELKRALLEQGINYDEWKKQLKNQVLQQKLIQKELGDKITIENSELLDYYKKHLKEFKEEAVYTLQAIFVDGTHPDSEKRKKEIVEKLKQIDFARVAGEYSDEPLKKLKGELGIFKESELAPEILKIVKKLKKGDLSNWIEYKNGWLIIKLKDFKPERIPEFKEVQNKIREKIYFQKREKFLKEYIKELKKEAYIKIYKKQ